MPTTKQAKSQTDERQEIKDLIDCLSERRLEPAEWFMDFITAPRRAAARRWEPTGIVTQPNER